MDGDIGKGKIYFRHDKIREHQDKFIQDVYSAVKEKKILLAHAPTGAGKTDASISAALSYALANDLTVFFLTPKISQHRIAVDVVRGLAKKHDLNIRGIDMLGRRHACIDSSLKDLDHDGFYQSCERKRRNEQCAFYGNARGYGKVGEAKANLSFGKMLSNYGAVKSHDELIATGEAHAACPYEWMIKLCSTSNIIVADYFHVLVPKIRELFLKKINKSLDKSIIIIDEAHNLAKRIRDQLSSSLNSFMLRRAEREIKALGMGEAKMERAFENWCANELKGKENVLVSKDGFLDFLSAYGMESKELSTYFENAGTKFIEKTNRKSACLKLAKFIDSWKEDDASSVRIIKKRGVAYSLSKKFLDPSMATSVLNEAHASILMSGTLLPLDMHRDMLGLDRERTVMKSYASPFNKGNVLNVIVDGITTQYSKRSYETYRKMAGKIDAILENSPKEAALFFPSYSVLNSVTPLMKNKGRLLVQQEKSSPAEIGDMIRRFSRQEGILCAVQGGSLSEGVDYANNEIKTAIIVGIALEEPDLETQARIDHYQNKFGRGWEYGYTYPAIIKAQQAAGRCIRKETDRAAIVFMDERFKWKSYKSILDDGRAFVVTTEPEKYVREFWGIKQQGD